MLSGAFWSLIAPGSFQKHHVENESGNGFRLFITESDERGKAGELEAELAFS